MTTTPHPVDVHVGQRIRSRRKALAISQTKLAESMDLTFQQVQKYERGANRISASKLWDCSLILGVEPGFFFEGLDARQTAGARVDGLPGVLIHAHTLCPAIARLCEVPKAERAAIGVLIQAAARAPG